MPTNTYLRPLIRWWRLIVAITMLAVVASTISSLFQADFYTSTTTLVVGKTFLDPNPDSGQIIIAQTLAGVYADMAGREPIQQATKEALGIEVLPIYHAQVIPNTQMLQISVTDTNPKRAQIIASELANQLIRQSPTISGTETGERQNFIKEQLSSLEKQIQETEKTIEDLEKDLVGTTSASQIANIEKQIAEQTSKLSSLRSNYAVFLGNSQQGAVNILSIVEPASLPEGPEGGSKFLIIGLAGLVGLSLATGAAYLLELLDRTIKTTSDVERIFNLPVIGYISEISENGSKATYVAKKPNSAFAENFRWLWSNIEFFRINKQIKTLLITSPSQGNGKTTISSNLAILTSQEDRDVVLVDADVRRPAVHRALKMTRAPGLCDAISTSADIQTVVRQWKDDGCLKVVTAGARPPNITEVSASNKVAAILKDLKKNHELIIIDAPPLIIADSYNLASKADGVIVVIEPGRTTDEQARAMKEQLSRANAKIIGFVFNKLSEESLHSYGDYQYGSLYSPQYYEDYVSRPGKKSHGPSRSKRLADFFEHGKLPPGVSSGVESAITAIKTTPRDMLSRIKKSKHNDNGHSNGHSNGQS